MHKLGNPGMSTSGGWAKNKTIYALVRDRNVHLKKYLAGCKNELLAYLELRRKRQVGHPTAKRWLIPGVRGMLQHKQASMLAVRARPGVWLR